MGPALALASSAFVFSGAVQATIGLLAAGGSPAVIVLTAILLNARHVLLGGVLRPRVGGSLPRRLAIAWFLIDEATALALARPERPVATLLTVTRHQARPIQKDPGAISLSSAHLRSTTNDPVPRAKTQLAGEQHTTSLAAPSNEMSWICGPVLESYAPLFSASTILGAVTSGEAPWMLTCCTCTSAARRNGPRSSGTGRPRPERAVRRSGLPRSGHGACGLVEDRLGNARLRVKGQQGAVARGVSAAEDRARRADHRPAD